MLRGAREIMQYSRFTVAFAIGIAGPGVTACGADDTGVPPGTSTPKDGAATEDAIDSGLHEDVAVDDVTSDAGAVDDVTSDAGAVDDVTSDAGAVEDAANDVPDAADLPRFSFFYTSLEAMRRLSGSQKGFGGDLRFGMPTGLEGADKICQTIASDIGFGAKKWRAFLSVTRGPQGAPVHAIERIGDGPWYDRKGRLIAQDRAGLLAERPAGDPEVINDLPEETGEGTSPLGHTSAITGSNLMGRLYFPEAKNTCNDWTSNTLEAVFVMCGHPWLTAGAGNWLQSHPERSCIPGVRTGDAGNGDGSSIASGGGWGGFYCFALTP
jgi:hypothetical protein